MTKRHLIEKYGAKRASAYIGYMNDRGEAWLKLNHPEAYELIMRA